MSRFNAGPYRVTALPAGRGVHPPSPGQADRSTQRHSSACRSKSQTRPGNPAITSQSSVLLTFPGLGLSGILCIGRDLRVRSWVLWAGKDHVDD